MSLRTRNKVSALPPISEQAIPSYVGMARISLPETSHDQLAQQKQTIGQLEEMIAVLSSQVEGLEASLSAAQSKHTNGNMITVLGENTALKRRAQQLEIRQGQFELAQQHASALERENTSLQEILKESRKRFSISSHPRLRLELLDKQTRILEMKNLIAELEKQCQNQISLITRLSKENAQLKRDVDQLTGVIQLRNSRQGCFSRCILL